MAFIGPTVHKSTNIGGSPQWKLIWDNIFEVYDSGRDKSKFYWDLTTCLGKFLFGEKINFIDIGKKMSVRFKNIDDEKLPSLVNIERSLNYDFDFLLKIFIYLSLVSASPLYDESETITVSEKDLSAINNALLNINGRFRSKFGEIHRLLGFDKDGGSSKDAVATLSADLQKDLIREIETLFSSLYLSLRGDVDEGVNETVKLLPDNIVQYWNNIGPIFWLWLHLTSGKLTYMTDRSYDSIFKEFFLNIDIFVGCAMCKKHFTSMKETKHFETLRNTLETDMFIIVIHEKVRQVHARNHEGNVDYIDENVLKNTNYLSMLRDDYKNWWTTE